MDSRAPRDGRAIEEVGFYHPIAVDEKQLEVKEERIKEWLKNGARPSQTVKKLLNKKNIRIN